MRILAIETSTSACAAALDVDGVVTVEVVERERRHTETLAPAIASLLEGAGLRPRDLERVVVDRGPGLFTGLRVGLATAQALADATGAALVGVSSLELLARGARDAGATGTLLAVVDARRGEVFVQGFDLATTTPLDEPRVARPEEVATRVRALPSCILAGDGARRYRDLLVDLPGALVLDLAVPPVAAALALGRDRAPGAVAPLYLREADAVINFATRERS